MILNDDFYNQNTVDLAKSLLGKILIHESKEGITSGIIVETEAYMGDKDPASHTFRGKSERTKAMFGESGHAYIYFTYGMYYCFNVTAGPVGTGHGVLIRALEPVEGIELMKKRRGMDDIKNLCSGPAKLVLAMGITKDLYGTDLKDKPLYISEVQYPEFDIVTTTRIGLGTNEGANMPLRFYIKDNKYISKK